MNQRQWGGWGEEEGERLLWRREGGNWGAPHTLYTAIFLLLLWVRVHIQVVVKPRAIWTLARALILEVGLGVTQEMQCRIYKVSCRAKLDTAKIAGGMN